MNIGAKTSVALLALISLLLTGYLVTGVLKVDPLGDKNTVVVDLKASGGLLPRSKVLFNGIEVGQVSRIDSRSGGLRATLSVDADYEIPMNAAVNVENLSLVGEQYLNFSSDTGGGPYLVDGAEIDPSTSTATVSEMLGSMQELTGQIDTDTLESLAQTINEGWEGRDADLDRIGDFSKFTSQTINTHTSEFSGLFDNAQQLLLNMDGYGDVMRAAAPKLAAMNVPFATLWSLFPGLAKATEGPNGWYNVVVPFVEKIGEYLSRTLPKASPVVAVLQPYLTAAAPSMRLDLGALVERGLEVVDTNGAVQLKATIPQ